MKVSLNWLREFVELPPTTEALVELLTLAGVEVEEVIHRGVAIENVVVAQIRESLQHPNADRLSVCQVDDGSGTSRQIVCGAKNYCVGDKVPLALPGAVLPGDFKIKVGKLRGVESQGMLCSAKELALSEDAEGLLILAADVRIGAPIGELFPSDTILDLEITPNRPDLLSHFGIAREIGALSRKDVRGPALRVKQPLAACEDVQVTAPPCPEYSARRLSGVQLRPSPGWLREKLEAIGLRPINNVVDVTNFVMMELGQPLHAFDAARLNGPLQVRFATEGEDFRALDGKTYRLTGSDMVIADDERAVALAGIMGGEDSGVSAATSEVWLESANFFSQAIRRTSRRLGLTSESSYRFERNIDWDTSLHASQRAVELILEVAGGREIEPFRLGEPGPWHDANFPPVNYQVYFPGVPGPENDEAPLEGANGRIFVSSLGEDWHCSIELRADRIERLLGRPVAPELAHDILERLGLRLENGHWRVPSFRSDLWREVDLIEEIARVIGMDVIPARVQARFAPASASDSAYDRAMELRRALVAQGLHEARSLTLVPAEPRGLAFTLKAASSLLRVRNPMIEEQVVLRPNLLHGLLNAVSANLRAGAKSVRLFEIGRVFSADGPQPVILSEAEAGAGGRSAVEGPGTSGTHHRKEETSHASVVLTGPIHGSDWRGSQTRAADLYDLKGILTAALGPETRFAPDNNPALALSLTVKAGDVIVGVAGQLWPADARALDATAPVLFAALDLDALAEAGSAGKKYREIARFPSVTRDIALLAPLTLPHETIASTLTSAQETLLAGVELFDVFADPSGAKIPPDRRSLAYSLTYRSAERTLTSEEVNAAHGRLKERLKSELGVSLRE